MSLVLMQLPEQIQFGSTIVRYLDNGRLVIRDAQDSSQVQIIHDDDVPRLIDFLLQWSNAARGGVGRQGMGESPTV